MSACVYVRNSGIISCAIQSLMSPANPPVVTLCAMWDRGRRGGGRGGVRLEGGGDRGQQSMWLCSMSPGDATCSPSSAVTPRPAAPGPSENNKRTAATQPSGALM